MPKILFYDYNLPYLIQDTDHPVGGATVQLYSWLKGLSKLNKTAGVLTFKGAKSFIKKPVDFEVIETYLKSEGFPVIRWITHRFPALLKNSRKYKPDFIIRGGAGFETGIISLIAKMTGAKFIYRAANDIDSDERYKKRISLYSRVLFRRGLKNASAIICQNEYQYKNFKKKFPEKKIIIIHNPFYNNGSSNHPPKNLNKRKYIAWVGIFSAKKNLPLLLEITEELSEYEFRIAGKLNFNVDKTTKDTLKKLKERDNVKLVGYLGRKEIPAFLSEAYFLLNTSHFEGFSNTFLEAFSAGTPVITSSGTDPDDIIQNNKLGFVYKNKSEIKNFINSEVFKDEDSYKTTALKCQKYVCENHNPSLLAEKLFKFLGTV